MGQFDLESCLSEMRLYKIKVSFVNNYINITTSLKVIDKAINTPDGFHFSLSDKQITERTFLPDLQIWLFCPHTHTSPHTQTNRVVPTQQMSNGLEGCDILADQSPRRWRAGHTSAKCGPAEKVLVQSCFSLISCSAQPSKAVCVQKKEARSAEFAIPSTMFPRFMTRPQLLLELWRCCMKSKAVFLQLFF